MPYISSYKYKKYKERQMEIQSITKTKGSYIDYINNTDNKTSENSENQVFLNLQDISADEEPELNIDGDDNNPVVQGTKRQGLENLKETELTAALRAAYYGIADEDNEAANAGRDPNDINKIGPNEVKKANTTVSTVEDVEKYIDELVADLKEQFAKKGFSDEQLVEIIENIRENFNAEKYLKIYPDSSVKELETTFMMLAYNLSKPNNIKSDLMN